MRLSIALLLLGWLQAPQTPQTPQTHGAALSPSRAAFERVKTLEGTWAARSTKGWTETASIQIIAGGSAVLETSADAHPGETMATVFHMDGDRLLLTHYCVAGNQPRLQATAFANDGKDVTFTFLDATNLPSRDRGHMDKVVFHFIDEDHYSSQWTWFENGHEQWLELIIATRRRNSLPQ
jgi:hypothetical protein